MLRTTSSRSPCMQDGDEDGDGGGWAADVAGGGVRAVLRVQRSMLRTMPTRLPALPTRLPALKATKGLERLAAAHDAADAVRAAADTHGVNVHALYKRAGAAGLARASVRPFLASAAAGTLLFATYDTAAEHAGDVLPAAAPLVCGAAGGVAHAALSTALSSERQWERLPRAALVDAVQFGVAFQTYALARSTLLRVLDGGLDENAEHAALDSDVYATHLAAFAAAGALAGAAQEAAAQLMTRQRPTLRSLVRAAPAAGLGFAAWELGSAAHERSNNPAP